MQCERQLSVREIEGVLTNLSMKYAYLKPSLIKMNVNIRLLSPFCLLSVRFLRGFHIDILYFFPLSSSPVRRDLVPLTTQTTLEDLTSY
jgi:hypothetical protein